MTISSLITKKIGCSSVIDENGAVSQVTLLSASPNVVTQIKSVETDGYNALQISANKVKKLNKAITGHVKKSKFMPSIIKEIRVQELEGVNVGDEIKADVFNIGDKVHATSISKGKGFAGTIKRHNFHRGRKTHGGRSYRRPGSIGSMYPQKIFKGKKMSGHMGCEQVTIKNLTVSHIDLEKNIIGIKGSVPGPNKSTVLLRGVN